MVSIVPILLQQTEDEDRGSRMEDGGWRMEDGGWKMDDG
jgi:hypothetical protein